MRIIRVMSRQGHPVSHDIQGVSTTKQPGDMGYVIEGNRETPVETTEVWTFMRYQHGKWLLSAIQQVS